MDRRSSCTIRSQTWPEIGNDAVVDGQGRLWFGTMDNSEVLPTGRFNHCGCGKCGDNRLPPVAIINGPAVNDEGRTLYPVDT